jgi:hypothetical protein
MLEVAFGYFPDNAVYSSVIKNFAVLGQFQRAN